MWAMESTILAVVLLLLLYAFLRIYDKKYKLIRKRPVLENEKRKKPIEHWQLIAGYLIAFDMCAIAVSYFLALWIRFDGRYSQIPADYLLSYLMFLPWAIVFTIMVFYMLRLYQSMWRFFSIRELVLVTFATGYCLLYQVLGITLFVERMPLSYYVIGIGLQFLFTLGIRFSYRLALSYHGRRHNGDAKEDKRLPRVMIVGAGAAGQIIMRDLQRAKETEVEVCCFIDDNPNKWNRHINGIPIVGGRDMIKDAVAEYGITRILVAMPSASTAEKTAVLNICKDTRCELLSLPGVYQLVNGEVTLSQMKEVAVEDLLGRDPIKVEMQEIFDQLSGKTILVTGGGGSIGSELCRQIAGHGPKQLVIFDIYENNAYDIQQELRHDYPNLNLVTLIGSVRDNKRIDRVFEQYKPDIVYHAAAHKHVPLMEDSPCESIKNNVLGTYKTACAALRHGTQRFVLISTDKAVNPTNIMGASKRLCEMVVQSMDLVSRSGRVDLLPTLNLYEADNRENDEKLITQLRKVIDELPEDREHIDHEGRCEYVAVRFGNVLGSNGSVIPLFKKQIAAGGPVTVTHPDIIRYFMTIPEAVSLVLQAGTYARGGEIFVLDMGDPVKIDTLARNLILLSGHKPEEDIKIQYSGLRPGEKLFEEKLMAEEGLMTTPNHLIHIGKPLRFDISLFFKQLRILTETCYENQDNIFEVVEEVVTTYHPDRKNK